MKIFEIIPHLQSGGGEKFVVDLTNKLAEMGHQCTLLSLYDPMPEDILREYISAAVTKHSFAKRRGIDFRVMFAIARYIRRHRPDVVHLHLNAITYILLAAIVCRKTKFVATIHSEASREAGTGINRAVRKLLFGLKLVTPVTISEESELSFERFYGYAAQMVENGCVEYNLRSQSRWSELRQGVDMLFLHAGRILGVKNQLMLVRAFDALIREGHSVRLVIAGRVADEQMFQQIKGYFSDNIVYVGEQSDIRQIMSVADGFCLSSLMEGMPITVIEAFSVGCVPVCTPVGGCVNMIEEGVSGFLSADTTEQQYVAALRRFVTATAEHRYAMSEKVKAEFVAKYSIDITAKNYLTIFGDEK